MASKAMWVQSNLSRFRSVAVVGEGAESSEAVDALPECIVQR